MPKIGFGYAPVDAKGAAAIRALAPAHIRVDLHIAKSGWKEELAAAEALGLPLELAIFGAPDAVLAAAPKNVARYLIFDVRFPVHRS